MTDSFAARFAAVRALHGPLAWGLDPSADLLDNWGLGDGPDGLDRFADIMLAAAPGVVGLVKPQSAFYERHGGRGIATLQRLIESARGAGLLVILDIKRGDVGSTNDAYAKAYLGMTVPDFPNLFALNGPNTLTGHGGSLLFLAECEMHYMMDLVRQMIENDLTAVECRAEVYGRYNRDVDAQHERMIWTHPGMTTYYRNSHGRVVVNSPWRVVDFWTMTRRADLADYVVDKDGVT